MAFRGVNSRGGKYSPTAMISLLVYISCYDSRHD